MSSVDDEFRHELGEEPVSSDQLVIVLAGLLNATRGAATVPVSRLLLARVRAALNEGRPPAPPPNKSEGHRLRGFRA